MHKFFMIALLFPLGGCATIVEGVDQTIQVEVVPAHGTCEVRRDGEKVGFSTPERRQVTLSKSKRNLEFTCSAPGYQTRTEVLSSELSPATVGSFFLLDLGVVDAATGAWQKYPSRVTVVMQKG
ncbi:MAG: hypothetical protein SGJ17_10760 [Hyphomicrobiales bacterium]|nr:hypothetical protein [Hyphomicrobiales bacterium]